MVSGNQIIYPKQNDNMKVNERLIRNQNLQRASTLELVMVFMLTLIVSMSIFLLFDILTIRERLNFPGELDRVQVWDMNGFNDEGKYNDKPDSLDSANSLGSSLFPSAKRKPAHRKSILSDGFKSTQPVDIKTITFPDFDYPISTNVTRKNSFVIFRLHSHPPPFYQDSTLKDKDSDFNTGVTSLVPFGFNRFNPFDMNSHFSSIFISIKPINDTKSKPSGNTVNHPKNSTMPHKTSNKKHG